MFSFPPKENYSPLLFLDGGVVPALNRGLKPVGFETGFSFSAVSGVSGALGVADALGGSGALGVSCDSGTSGAGAAGDVSVGGFTPVFPALNRGLKPAGLDAAAAGGKSVVFAAVAAGVLGVADLLAGEAATRAGAS